MQCTQYGCVLSNFRWVDPSENDPIKIRNETMFFKTVDLLYNEGKTGCYFFFSCYVSFFMLNFF